MLLVPFTCGQIGLDVVKQTSDDIKRGTYPYLVASVIIG